MGIPAIGLHSYRNSEARMHIKMLGLFTIQDESGEIMNQSETVTWFNDLCLMAPARLIDPRISWEILNERKVKATFNGKYTISAVLSFGENGALLNFVSNDRYEFTGNGNFVNNPFSTPVLGYMEIDGRRLLSKGQAVYTRPETGEFVYGEFILKNMEYNPTGLH